MYLTRVLQVICSYYDPIEIPRVCWNFTWSYKALTIRPDPEGGQEVWTPLKNHKNIRFQTTLVQISWKYTELPSQHSMFEPSLAHQQTQFK